MIRLSLRPLAPIALLGLLLPPSLGAQLPFCVGDCNGDGVVTVDEVLLGVNIALGAAPMSACPSSDVDQNGALTVDELITSVDAALRGCTSSPPPTPTPIALGPNLTSLAVAAADDRPVAPTGVDGEGRPIYSRLFGSGFWIIAEAAPGPLGIQIDPLLFAEAPLDRNARPDVQILVSRALGDGNPAVCDHDPARPPQGGVPAAEPFAFADGQGVTDVMAEMSCRIRGGTRTNPNDACTQADDAPFGFAFINPESRVQFCVRIEQPWRFPVGDTIVAARVLDIAGNAGAPREIVVRVNQ